MSELILEIEGMSCQHCVRHVGEALSALPGVTGVSVDLDSGSARIETGADWDGEAARQALLEAGYTLAASRPA